MGAAPQRRWYAGLMSMPLRPVLFASAFLAAGFTVSCSGTESNSTLTSGSGTGGNGGGATSGSGGSSTIDITSGPGSSGSGGSGGGTCGATAFPIEILQPNVVIVFDRSCSMRRLYDDSLNFGTGPDDPATRWYVARTAIDQITAAYESRVRFGLMVFPGELQGCPDTPAVDVLPDVSHRAEILAYLDSVHPFPVCGPPNSADDSQPHQTPTAEALTALDASGVVADPARADYVLLVTDGGASCNATPESLGALSSALLAKGAKTAVVGFGDVASDPAATNMMNSIAQQGGLPKPDGPPYFWLASQPQDIGLAIDTIVAEALSCTFKLKDTPPDGDKLFAYFDGTAVPNGGADGFAYDAGTNSVTFVGSACTQLQEAKVKNVSVVYGCPDPTCVPSSEVCDGLDNDCNGVVDDDACVN